MIGTRDPFGPGPAGLYRDPAHGRIAGVCAGLADYLGLNRCGLRAAVLILCGLGLFGPLLIAYLILAVALRPMPPNLFRDSEDEAFYRSMSRRPADTLGGLTRRFRDMEDRLARMERRVTSPEEAMRARFNDL